MFSKNIFIQLLIVLISLFCTTNSYTQQTDTLRGKNLYRPVLQDIQDTIKAMPPWVDSAQHVKDSLERRLQFVKDSIFTREQFVRDSLQRRQHILDSLTYLQHELNILLDVYFKTVREDIILRSNKIVIAGDSVLSDYAYLILSFSLTQPYTPWKAKYKLAGNSIKYITDSKIQK